MSTDIAKKEQVDIAVGLGNLQSFELSQRVAKMLASSTLVPKVYQGNISNCVIALNMASRMDADPLMVMQNLYIVHGHPGWSSQFLISTFNTCGKFSSLRYEFIGTPGKDDYGCKAWAIEKATGEKLEGSTVTIAIAKQEGWYGKDGSKWKTMPQQMLMYRAASWFIRAYAPEIAMGMHTEEEIRDIYDMGPDDYEIVVDKEIKENANKETIDVKFDVVDENTSEPETEPEEEAKEEPAAEKEPFTAGAGQQTIEGPGF
jgi:hypothetical protein